MAAVTWKFVLTDLAGVQIGEVQNATSRQVVRSLNGASTAGFTIDANNSLLSTVLNTETMCRAYRNGTLIFHGRVTSLELAADDPTAVPVVAVGFTDPAFRLTSRIANKTGAVVANAADKLTITESLINTANTEVIDGSASDTGIATLGQTCGSAGYVIGPYKPLNECVQEMALTLDGFDWRMDPIEYAAGKIANFKAAALLSTTQNNAVFEYQGRGNMKAPHYQKDWSGLANKAYHITSAGPAAAGYGVREGHNTASLADLGRYEVVVGAEDVTTTASRDALLADTVNTRGRPRRVLSFSPDFDDQTGRVPAYGTDYQIGDTVRARVLWNGVSLVDGMIRLYRMQFDIDSNNTETLTPTVVDESS